MGYVPISEESLRAVIESCEKAIAEEREIQLELQQNNERAMMMMQADEQMIDMIIRDAQRAQNDLVPCQEALAFEQQELQKLQQVLKQHIMKEAKIMDERIDNLRKSQVPKNGTQPQVLFWGC